MENAADEPGLDILSVSLVASTSSLQPQTCYDDEISLFEDIRPYKANAGPAMKNKQSKISSNNHHSRME